MPNRPSEISPFAAVIAHQMRDYETWINGFNKHEDTRRELGILGHHINRTVEHPDVVRLYIPCLYRAPVAAFLASDQYRSLMKEYGASSVQTVTWLRPLRTSIFRERQLPCVVVTQQVSNVDTWLEQYDADTEARSAAGILGDVVNQMADEPSVLAVYYQAETFAELRTFINLPDQLERMPKEGPYGERQVSYQVGEFGIRYS
ncbi:MAG: hypothetical protein KUG57_10485 [Ilumatobacteraceae bacterium]|nr:hypothetical protein [Ilumatobacteraceae bacterium]